MMEKLSRRHFLSGLALTGSLARKDFGLPTQRKIERAALVQRHSPVLRKLDPLSPLSLGNGEFAFTADITGLQTVPARIRASHAALHAVAVGLAHYASARPRSGARSGSLNLTRTADRSAIRSAARGSASCTTGCARIRTRLAPGTNRLATLEAKRR
jgi:hypothetical protein